MKVIVTGGCGFLGYHVCSHFRKRGASVIAYDNLAKHEFARNPYMKESAREYNQKLLQKQGVTVVVGDICDREFLFDQVQGSDYICHTAAQPAMTMSWEDPKLDFATNTYGTFNVLEAARQNGIPVAICSSIHTFGPDGINNSLQEGSEQYLREPVAISEEEPLLQGMVTPLHASKRSNEIYTQSYIDTYQLKAACFRLTGIYGPNQFGGEDHGWVANFTIRNILGLPISIFGTGKQTRDVLYATDVASAFEAFYQTPEPGIYNIGGGPAHRLSLLQAIREIQEITANKSEVLFKPERPGDLRYFVADYSKFHNATGWTPAVLPREGIRRLAQWVKENLELFESGSAGSARAAGV